MDLSLWYGVFAPAGTPRAIVELLGRELVAVVVAPDLTERFVNLGLDPAAAGPKAAAETAGGRLRALAADRAAGRLSSWTRVSLLMFSKAFEAPRPSAIRELFPYMSRPDMISLAGGYPSPDLFDAEGLHAAMERAMQAAPSKWLQYAATEGEPALREALAAWMARRGIDAPADRILVTSGSGQALDLLLRVLIDRGDTHAGRAAELHDRAAGNALAGAQLVGVGADADGIDVQELETRLPRTVRAKALYIVPTFANPSGATLSLARRKRLLELARAASALIIIEDDAYGDLRFEGTPVPPLAALANEAGAEEYVVHLSTLSKIVAPGSAGGLDVRRAGSPAPLRDRQADDRPVHLALDSVRGGGIPEGRRARAQRGEASSPPTASARRRWRRRCASNLQESSCFPRRRAGCSSGERFPPGSTPARCCAPRSRRK